jgi:hypothetical protein
MTLPNSGTITANMINTEPPTDFFSMNGTEERKLAGVPAPGSTIWMSNFYGKSSVNPPSIIGAVATNGSVGTSIAVALPSHITGDILVVILSHTSISSTTQTYNVPAGWNNIGRLGANANQAGYMCIWKIGQQESSVTVTTGPNSSSMSACAMSFRSTGNKNVTIAGPIAGANPPAMTADQDARFVAWAMTGQNSTTLPNVAVWPANCPNNRIFGVSRSQLGGNIGAISISDEIAAGTTFDPAAYGWNVSVVPITLTVKVT